MIFTKLIIMDFQNGEFQYEIVFYINNWENHVLDNY